MSFVKLSRVLVWLAALVIFGAGISLLTVRAAQDVPPNAVPLRLIVVNSALDAEKILEQLNGGADFAVLARELSTDATSVDGGFMGTMDSATLRGELRAGLKGVAPGGFSPVVKLPTGFAMGALHEAGAEG